MIRSLQNKRIKLAIKLRRRRGRDDQHRFLIDGQREIQQALDANVEMQEAFVCRACPASDTGWLDMLTSHTEMHEVSLQVWEKLNYGNRKDPAIVIARRTTPTLQQLAPYNSGPIFVLDQIEKPGNVGAVFRTAAGAGAAAVIVADPQTDLFNPNTIRASLGTVFAVPAAVGTADAALDFLQHRNLMVFVAQPNATLRYFDAELNQPCAIVLGSEAYGVSETWLDPELTGIHIPMTDRVNSLNVATAAGVLLYESQRQRMTKPNST